MQQTPTSFLSSITKALRANFDDVANEPLPQRWIDLIHHLNERERIDANARKTHQSDPSPIKQQRRSQQTKTGPTSPL